MWVHLFTGPERYAQQEIRMEIEKLVRERDALKASAEQDGRLENLRDRLSRLAGTITPGYTYTGTVYREIGMQNSDFGGMENVGNTTITTNRIMPFPEMTDPAYEYMIRVKVHEYYHNLNGSEVTGCTPFELWLNEAVTVLVERWHHAFLFGGAYSRLETVLTLLSPESGTLALDAGSTSMPIEPDGFDDPNDLITGITYVKGPEFVRMIESMMGKEAFVRGLDLYHRRYRHGNATTGQWIAAMEETAGQDLSRMAEVWLRRTGYPTIAVGRDRNANGARLALTIDQSCLDTEMPWIFPFHAIAYDSEGNQIGEAKKLVERRHDEAILELDGIPAFISINPGYAAYGRLADDATVDELHLQVRRDPDLVNRYVAFSRLAEQELMRLLVVDDVLPGEPFLDLFVELAADDELMHAAGGQFLTIYESVSDPRYMHRYRALFEARKRLLSAIAARHHVKLRALYRKYSLPHADASLQDRARGIKQRQVKNLCLSVLATLDTPEIHALIRDQISRSTNATDRITAFALYVQSSAPDKRAQIERFQAESRENLVAWEAFLAAIGSNTAPDTVEIIRRVAESPAFRIEQSNEQRALFGRFAQNRMISLQTPEGRALFAEILQKLAVTNEFSTVQALRAFANLDTMEEEFFVPLVAILAELIATLDPEKTPSVYNTIRRILAGSPRSVHGYETERGPIAGLQ
ncbi:MAG: DUF3458 domain-containing protein [Methanobacteriota archaeon]|nr:MAG: DUF3458 domain-containing protein [Euryarchaeota archaeon]